MVEGDIATKRILVHEGGEVNGNVKMGEVALPQAEAPAPESGIKGQPAPQTFARSPR
jgi:cytoskeletal protein CcmA (bactofilin family)